MVGYAASAPAEGGEEESGVVGMGEVEASSAVMLGIVAQGTSAKSLHWAVLQMSDHIDFYVASMYTTDIAHPGGCDATVGISIGGSDVLLLMENSGGTIGPDRF